ncbi:MAG: phasin family protein [Deltaproteobacteria bacterium]
MEQSDQQAHERRPQDLFRELWSQAVVRVGTAEDEVRRLLERLSEVVDLKPEDIQRYRRELADRLRLQRNEVEKAVESGIRRALGRLRIPTQEEVLGLRTKVEELQGRLEKLARQKPVKK